MKVKKVRAGVHHGPHKACQTLLRSAQAAAVRMLGEIQCGRHRPQQVTQPYSASTQDDRNRPPSAIDGNQSTRVLSKRDRHPHGLLQTLLTTQQDPVFKQNIHGAQHLTHVQVDPLW